MIEPKPLTKENIFEDNNAEMTLLLDVLSAVKLLKQRIDLFMIRNEVKEALSKEIYRCFPIATKEEKKGDYEKW